MLQRPCLSPRHCIKVLLVSPKARATGLFILHAEPSDVLSHVLREVTLYQHFLPQEGPTLTCISVHQIQSRCSLGGHSVVQEYSWRG